MLFLNELPGTLGSLRSENDVASFEKTIQHSESLNQEKATFQMKMF